MVTVIADKGELTAPVHNGVPAGSNDMERPYQYIKDYQEVDFYRSPSCKPLPEDFLEGNPDAQTKSSIKGTFFVQIVTVESATQLNTNNPSVDQGNDSRALLLTLTDGYITVRGLTTDRIADLSLRTRSGCKLLLTGVIAIDNGLLQLTHENTQFQYGSSTFPRPRSAYRGRGGGSYRPSFEGRRGGGSNARYDEDAAESHFLKRPPPKNTLMDFMKPPKPSDDAKPSADSDNQKLNDRYENKRRSTDQYPRANNGFNATNSNQYYQSHQNYPEQVAFQPDGLSEPLESEDDPSHANYRERRNPLPPRLQRAQEERTRRTSNRYYDESTFVPGVELNGAYRNGAASHPSLSSSTSFSRRADSSVYMAGNPSNAQQHPATLNYVPHANMLAAVNASGQPHLAYFQAASGPLSYGLPGISSAQFHGQLASGGASYSANDHLAFYYSPAFATPAYLPPTVTNGFSDEYKAHRNQSSSQTKSAADENEIKTGNEPQVTDNTKNNSATTTDAENKSQPSSTEQKVISSSSTSTASSNDGNHASQPAAIEQNDEKRRDTHANPRPRWRVGDMCLARWSEDREFYVATVVQIQPPYCTVMFRDYNSYDRVHFGDLKILPRDQQYFQMVPPLISPTSDLNPLAASAYFPTRTAYYPSTIDGCLMMPEAPPFPFNSAGTLYMCPPALPAVIARSTRYPPDDFSSFQQPDQRNEHENSTTVPAVNSASPPTMDSNDTGIIDSTATSVDDNQQRGPASLANEIRLCSIADAPLILVTKDEDRERSTSTESLTSSRYEEQQSTNEEEKTDKDTSVKSSPT